MFMHNKHRSCHIDNRNALGNADNQWNACAGGFHNGIGCTCGRDKDTRCVSTCGSSRLSDSIEDWYPFDGCTTLTRGDSPDQCSTSRFHVARMILSLAPGYTLHDDPRRIVK